jgi:hypothetical protein
VEQQRLVLAVLLALLHRLVVEQRERTHQSHASSSASDARLRLIRPQPCIA